MAVTTKSSIDRAKLTRQLLTLGFWSYCSL